MGFDGMLRGLDIRDILIIDRLELEFRPGLNVLTGETGAGKSILLESLGFVLGWRGRADLVRAGATQGEVTAVFDLPPGHPAREVLREAGLLDEAELILRRVNGADGRKTAWINDRRSSGEVLRRLSGLLVELHGQQDDHGLLNPRGHRRLLDTFASAEAALATVRGAWRSRRTAATALAEARARIEALRGEEENLRHWVSELDALNAEAGEFAALEETRALMRSMRGVVGQLAEVHGMIDGDGALALAAGARRQIDRLPEEVIGRIAAPSEALDRALDALDEAAAGISAAIESAEFEPARLEALEDRFHAIRDVARKHGVEPDALPAHAEDLRQRLEALDGAATDIAALEAACIAAEAEYDAAATILTVLRRDAGVRLDTAMTAELAPLKMERAVFRTEVSAAPDPGPDGRDEVTFTVATNPGAPAGALNRIASGGELSRFLLALKVCLTEGADGLTMIFDEIDRGVGGATADAVGRRLKSLAEGAQVLVVTHSPQVAALGAHHWRVDKRVADGSTLTHVTSLSPDNRVDEIARMLAGDRVTEEARAAARALLGDA
jgi:DNA repair protein RecN (Recombination protein N)